MRVPARQPPTPPLATGRGGGWVTRLRERQRDSEHHEDHLRTLLLPGRALRAVASFGTLPFQGVTGQGVKASGVRVYVSSWRVLCDLHRSRSATQTVGTRHAHQTRLRLVRGSVTAVTAWTRLQLEPSRGRVPRPDSPSHLRHAPPQKSSVSIVSAFRALSGRLKFTVRRHKSNKDSLTILLGWLNGTREG